MSQARGREGGIGAVNTEGARVAEGQEAPSHGMRVATDALDLGTILDYEFTDDSLLQMALTHRSFSNERGLEGNYERLEFLGDAVLGLVTSDWLYRRFPGKNEGELAKLKSFLVSARTLKGFARAIGVGRLLRLGVGEKRSGGSRKASILADVMEALFGAIYLDGGLEAVRRVIHQVLEEALAAQEKPDETDAKTLLQERVQAKGWHLPVYQLVDESGPDHRKVFVVECWVQGRLAGQSEGGSKKLAEQRAAAVALEWLDLMTDEA